MQTRFHIVRLQRNLVVEGLNVHMLLILALHLILKQYSFTMYRNHLFFTVSFDKSLKMVLQNEQMDIQVHFWDDNSVQAKTRYFDSQFLLSPNANNLLESLTTEIKDLSQETLIQFFMDGPSSNWSVFYKLSLPEEGVELPRLENVGSCGLYV